MPQKNKTAFWIWYCEVLIISQSLSIFFRIPLHYFWYYETEGSTHSNIHILTLTHRHAIVCAHPLIHWIPLESIQVSMCTAGSKVWDSSCSLQVCIRKKLRCRAEQTQHCDRGGHRRLALTHSSTFHLFYLYYSIFMHLCLIYALFF